MYGVIEVYVKERGYDFIFDKFSLVGMIFFNFEYDKIGDIFNCLK